MKPNKDPITATLRVMNRTDADTVRALFETYVEELPAQFRKDEWLRTLAVPADLYLTFPNRRKYGRFMRELAVSRTKIKVIAGGD